MINRITAQTIQHSTLSNLQLNLSSVSRLQAQLSSGKKVEKASDDPAHAAQLMSLRSLEGRNSQYDRNASDATSWLNTIDDALQTMSSTTRRSRDLVIQGGNGALSQVSKDSLAEEIDGLNSTMMSLANTTYLGRNVFAGTSSAGEAYDPTTYAWTGTDGAEVTRVVADATDVRVDSDGRQVFGETGTSVFALMDQIAATLRAGGDPTSYLNQLDVIADAVKTELASVGARENTVDTAAGQLSEAASAVKTQISGIEDVDLASVILQLQSQQVAYQGALGAASKVLTPSLMEFLK